MSKLKDLTGQKFGRLTVIERAENAKEGAAQWLCQCECGKKCVVRGACLRRGTTKSCGCWHDESSVLIHTKHGLGGDKIYRRWQGIKKRCFNPNDKSYSRYGARGITLYAPWKDDFQAFYDYVSKLPHFGEKGYTLDRINNDGNYEPGNIRWATKDEQNRNKRSNIIVEYQGEMMCLTDASEKSGINFGTLKGRYERGDRGERLFRPVVKGGDKNRGH